MSDATQSTEATTMCPVCGEQILAVALKCRYCGEYLDPSARPRPPAPSTVDRMLLPVGRPMSAIAAGYLALFSIIPLFGLIPGIAAVVCGVVALKTIRLDPELSGKGRAWFGIIVGGLTTLATLVHVAIMLAAAIVDGRR